MKIDPKMQDLTIGELETLVEVSGVTMGELMSGADPTPSVVKALVFVAGRRENPEFTVEDAAALKFSEIEWGASDPDPTEAAG